MERVTLPDEAVVDTSLAVPVMMVVVGVLQSRVPVAVMETRFPAQFCDAPPPNTKAIHGVPVALKRDNPPVEEALMLCTPRFVSVTAPVEAEAFKYVDPVMVVVVYAPI